MVGVSGSSAIAAPAMLFEMALRIGVLSNFIGRIPRWVVSGGHRRKSCFGG